MSRIASSVSSIVSIRRSTVRPIRLSVKGFTCFRDQAELDFSGLDLFAITGPTGSGKSSLIDAMTFALYGTSTRTGKDKKDCIALGMPSAEVSFEFSIGSGATPDRYRVARSLKRGPSQP